MATPAPFVMLHTLDQWRRAAHVNTALQAEGGDLGVLQLAWQLDERSDAPDGTRPPLPAGMAFDPWCRLYRARPELGQVEKLLWAAEAGTVEPVPLFAAAAPVAGDFAPDTAPGAGPLQYPVDVAADDQGNLFICEQGTRQVLVFDLGENTLLRRLHFSRVPIKLACRGRQLWLLFKPEPGQPQVMASFDARSQPRYLSLPPDVTAPADLVPLGADLYLLDKGGSADARIVPLAAPEEAFAVPYACALACQGDKSLVVARRAGEDFLRFEISAGSQSELPHLKARHYDGRGLVVTPDGDVAYWSTTGLRRATLARVRYQTRGRVTSFQLDSGSFQTQWGRLFIDACLPRGTRLTAQCLVLDEVPETDAPIARGAPDNVIGMTIHRPDLSPPMPPRQALANAQAEQAEHPFHRRERGNEMPWFGCGHDEGFRTYEAPVMAPPGRYLWVVLTLSGTARLTPRIRSLRAEFPSHDLLRRLPQVYSREPAGADFLRRFLALPEGQLRDLDLKATYRHLLLKAQAAPAELLPWLGSFLGLVVDRRWPESARRAILAECTWLFRYRGTVMGLQRFIELYLDRRVTLIEHFKVRGLGGALVGAVGDREALASNAVLGAGFRIGGKLGVEEAESITSVSIADAIETHAHRFSLVIAAQLNGEQLEVVRHILDSHRPAHTLFDICTLDAGMRLGVGLYAGLTSILGNTAGFGVLQVGASVLGRTDTLGRARAGTSVGNSRLGGDTRVG